MQRFVGGWVLGVLWFGVGDVENRGIINDEGCKDGDSGSNVFVY